MLRAAVLFSSLLSLALPVAAHAQPVTPERSARHRQGGRHLRLPARRQLPHPVFLFRRPRRSGIQGAVEHAVQQRRGSTRPTTRRSRRRIRTRPIPIVGADLRAEPLVFTVPAVEKGRYYSLQFIDMYTFNFAYVGSRATGNGAGSYLLAGPSWKGETPQGHQGGDPLRDGIRLRALPHAAVQSRRHRKRQEDPGRLQGRSRCRHSSASRRRRPRPPSTSSSRSRAERGDALRLNSSAVLNFILQFCPTHPSENGADGALRQARHRRRQDIRSPKRSRPRCARRSRTAWPMPGRPSGNTRRRSSTPARRPAPTASARARS